MTFERKALGLGSKRLINDVYFKEPSDGLSDCKAALRPIGGWIRVRIEAGRPCGTQSLRPCTAIATCHYYICNDS